MNLILLLDSTKSRFFILKMETTSQTRYSKRERNWKIAKWLAIGTGIIGAYIFFKVFNPYEVDFFPTCPFLYLTGYKCPGCGSQRAIHYIFNFEFVNAARENLLLMFAIPYMIVGAWFDTIKVKTPKQLKIRRFLFGQKAIWLILVLVIGFWILRNIL